MAAIMFTDMVGYTALGQRNESLSLALVEEQRRLIRPILRKHNGREVKTIGDAFLVEFSNAVDAVRCAYDIQRTIREFDFSLAPDKRIHLRIGIHAGEVVVSEGDISGDAVNVASRIEPLADDGGVCITRQVYDHVKNKVDVPLSSMGLKSLKNVSEPLEVYSMVMPWDKEKPTVEELDMRRIAVLPFVSMSPDPNDEYFADGLTEELIDRVCQVKELAVIARTSVMNYKGAKKSASQVGRELRAGALVEGSVRKSTNKIRVTAQLVKADTEEHLWSSKYDRDLADIFAVQSDIAEKVAEALKVQLLPAEREAVEKTPTRSPEAFTLYLKGRYYWNERTEEGLKKAVDYFRKAIDLDQNFALAYALLADSYGVLANYGLVAPEEALPTARKYAERAIQLDDSLSEGHLALSVVLWNELRLNESMREGKRAIELNQNSASAHHRYALGLALMGNLEAGLLEIRKAKDLDPLSPVINVSVGGALYALRRYDEAVSELEESLKAIPDYFNLFDYLGLSLVKASKYEEGIKSLKRALALSGGMDSVKADLAVGYAISKRPEEAVGILEELLALSKTKYVPPVAIGSIYAALGKRDDAMAWLERARREKSGALAYVMGDPVFLDSLGTDKRFVSLVEEMRKN